MRINLARSSALSNLLGSIPRMRPAARSEDQFEMDPLTGVVCEHSPARNLEASPRPRHAWTYAKRFFQVSGIVMLAVEVGLTFTPGWHASSRGAQASVSGTTSGGSNISDFTSAAVALKGCYAYSAQFEINHSPYHLLIDSGSPLTAVASKNCTTCSPAHLYSPSKQANITDVLVASFYGEGSGWAGTYVHDYVTEAGPQAKTSAALMSLVAINETFNGFFRPKLSWFNPICATPTDGILGLGELPFLPRWTRFSTMRALANHAPDAWSIALRDRGGKMWFGGYAADSVVHPPFFVPMIPRSLNGTYHYAINLDEVILGDRTMRPNRTAVGPMVVDTGTTNIRLPPDIFVALSAALRTHPSVRSLLPKLFTRMCSAPSSLFTSREHIDTLLPTLTLKFFGAGDNVTVTLPVTQSYLRAESSPHL